eukprot:Trichotokara_eunicae@DN6357_c2_g1_i4.p1
MTTKRDEGFSIGWYSGDDAMHSGKHIAVTDVGCSTGEVEFGCGAPNTLGSMQATSWLPKVYDADEGVYYLVKMRGRVGVTQNCYFASHCGGVGERHYFLRDGGDMLAYQGGYFGSIDTQMMRPNDAPFGDEFSCGQLTPEGRFQESCSDTITSSHYVYRLVSESEGANI